ENSWFPPTRWKAPRQVEALALDERVPTLSQQHTGGSGLIKDQAACGFKAFVKHRIKVSSLGAEAFGFTAIERGILLHEMMFHLWRELSSQSELRRIAPSALPERIEQAATSAFTKLEADAERRGFSVRTRVGESCWRLERQFCVEVVSVWMEQERERKIPFTAVSLEEEAVLNLNGLELTLRPDRIDRLEDGRGIVIDYKSSAPGKSRWIGPRPQEPQLPLYTFLDNTLKGIAFAPLTRDGHFVPLGENLGLTSGADKDLSKQTQGWAEDWDKLVSKWSSDLGLLAQAFLDGVANVDPTPGACQHCELQSACRIGQLRRAAHVVLEDESSE
ncbi:MAG: PD-(D/E)XK nuclease family protein, partial [Luminiphilus sp.]